MLSKLLFSTVAALALMASNVALASQGDEVVGKYACKGNDPTTTPSAFTGNITITQKGKQFIMAETDTAGDIVYSYNQLGILRGDQFIMAFQQSNDLKTFGTQYMHISKHGQVLKGQFAYWGIPDQVGSEHCKKIS